MARCHALICFHVKSLLISPHPYYEISPSRCHSIDFFEVMQGDSVPCDGVVVRGQADVSEALLTGEDASIAKGSGDAVLGGSIVSSGTCTPSLLVLRAQSAPLPRRSSWGTTIDQSSLPRPRWATGRALHGKRSHKYQGSHCRRRATSSLLQTAAAKSGRHGGWCESLCCAICS